MDSARSTKKTIPLRRYTIFRRKNLLSCSIKKNAIEISVYSVIFNLALAIKIVLNFKFFVCFDNSLNLRAICDHFRLVNFSTYLGKPFFGRGHTKAHCFQHSCNISYYFKRRYEIFLLVLATHALVYHSSSSFSDLILNSPRFSAI